MAYDFSVEELDLISEALNEAELAFTDDTAGKFKNVYDLIYEILTLEGTAYDQPVDGLEENVWIWIGGAREVNTGEGFFADFIRSYTRSQYEQRYHITLSDEDLNIASNNIARNFINDILGGTTPTINELGLIDAAPIAGSIFNQQFEVNYAPWSGTLLFPFLGIDSYYKEWLLTEETVETFKPLAGTYDLFSSAAAAIPLANSPFEIAKALVGTFGLGGSLSAYLSSQDLANETDSFINEIYKIEKYDFDLEFGSDLFSTGTKSANYVVGTLGSDTYNTNPIFNLAVNGTSDKDVIHAGLGNDHIFASDGDDLIDGGEGNDIIDAGEGNDLIVSGGGADKIIVGLGEDVILDGAAEDRLYIRASQLGLSKINDVDRLFPLLGGVSSFISYADFNGNKYQPDEIYYDTDNDGNIEYWFSSTFQDIVAIGPGDGAVFDGEDVLANLQLNEFSILYEMNGTDLEIKFFQGVSTAPPFSVDVVEDIDQYWNFHETKKPTFMVTLADYQVGQFGIQLTAPLELASIKQDNINTDPDPAAVETHNNAISYITNNGVFNETLGQMVATSPITDSVSGQPIEFRIKTGIYDDDFIGDETDEAIDGQAGDDTIDGAGGDDDIDGGFGDDIITGGDGNDTIDGGAGNDTVIGGAGADIQSGGSGIDTISYANSTNGVSIDLDLNIVSGGDAEGDSISNFEGVIGSNFTDSFNGSANSDSFYGLDGDDTLLGNAGDDTLDGGLGADIINGGEGLDIVSYQSSIAAVMVDLINQFASGGSATGDVISNIEGITGSSFIDTLIGNDFANVLNGAAGDDIISGNDGDDIIAGGEGADILDGGAGNDTLNYNTSAQGVIVDLQQETSSFGDANADQFTNFENVSGSNQNDTIRGDAGDNIIFGLEGDDNFIATAGSDTIIGGLGVDSLSFEDSAQAVQVNLETSSYSGGLAETIDAVSIENIVGTAFDDQLTGNISENKLMGGAGADTLMGGNANDELDGGAGSNDTAIYTGNQADYKITNYENGSLKVEDIRSEGPDGTDIIQNIEFLQFADALVATTNLNIENATPDLVDDQATSSNEDEVIIIEASTLLANDTEFDGEALTITNLLNVKNGTAIILPNGDIEFTPELNFNGITSFEYVATDGTTAPTTARVILDILPIADTPEPADDYNIKLYVGEPKLISKETLFYNDENTDGTPLEIVSVTALSGGTAELTQEGDVLFTPTGIAGEAGIFVYAISNNGILISGEAIVVARIFETVDFNAVADDFEGMENQPLTISFDDLLGNDLNDGTMTPSLLSFQAVTNGAITIGQNGDLIFTPDEDFSGQASFSYTATNGEGGEDTAIVTINIQADQQNNPPVANDDNGISLSEDQPLLIAANTLLANDTDAENDTLTIISVGASANGIVELTASGDVLFTPAINYSGPASFSYAISDGQGGTATAIANLIITPVNDAPTNLIISNVTIEENSIAGTQIGQLSITDPDQNDTISYALISGSGTDKFELVGNVLQVKQGVELDYETENTFDITIEATDQGGLTTSNSFTINLLDIVEDSTIIGTNADDVLNGTGADDTISGLAGNDQLFGNDGNDILIGGQGADDLNGGAGIDSVDYSASAGGVTILLTTFGFRPYGVGFGGDANQDHFVDIETVIGSNFNDLLVGDGSENTLDGGAGNDYLIGRGGQDQFVFKEGYGRDTIIDFNTNDNSEEKILIDFDGIDDFSDLSSYISGIGFFQSSTRIEFDTGDRLTLLGVRTNELSEENFDFI